MQLEFRDDLPFISIALAFRGKSTLIDNVLVDTGSASTILADYAVEAVDIAPELDDILYTIRGVGGIETVYTRHVQSLTIGQRALENVEIEIGGMNYGFSINGILGMDVLTRTGAVIDLNRFTIEFANDA